MANKSDLIWFVSAIQHRRHVSTIVVYIEHITTKTARFKTVCKWLHNTTKIAEIKQVITGSAVALHCCKAHSKINRKMENSTPCKIVTP